jgi:hypothetical protein
MSISYRPYTILTILILAVWRGVAYPPPTNRTISSLFCCGNKYIKNRNMNCKTNAEKVSSAKYKLVNLFIGVHSICDLVFGFSMINQHIIEILVII